MFHIIRQRVEFFVDGRGVASEKDFFGRGAEDAHFRGLVVTVEETHVWVTLTLGLTGK